MRQVPRYLFISNARIAHHFKHSNQHVISHKSLKAKYHAYCVLSGNFCCLYSCNSGVRLIDHILMKVD